MATQQNFFALLGGDDENEDPFAIVATLPLPPPSKTEKTAPLPKSQQQKASAKLPTKPPPPAQAVRDAHQSQFQRGRGGQRGGRGGSRGYNGDREAGYGLQNQEGRFEGENGVPSNGRNYSSSRGGRGGRGGRNYYGEFQQAENGDLGHVREGGRSREEAEGVRGGGGFYDGGRGGRGRGMRFRGSGYNGNRGFDGDSGEGFGRQNFDNWSGAGRGTEMKQEVSGQGSDGATETEQVAVIDDKPKVEKVTEEEMNQNIPKSEGKNEEEEVEDKEMTLDEYEKVLSDKRKALEVLKAKERKVKPDKDFESMQVIDKKRGSDSSSKITPSASDKEKGKKKESAEKDEKPRKAVSINEFLKPAEGEDYVNSGGRRGRARGRGQGGFRGGFGGEYNDMARASIPVIEDPGQFPSLSGK